MTIEIMLVFGIVGIALYLFASQRLPLDVSALAILATLMVIPLLGDVAWLRDRGVDLPAAFPTVEEGLSGLSSPATVTVLAMFILSAGIQRSRLMHVLGRAHSLQVVGELLSVHEQQHVLHIPHLSWGAISAALFST